MHANEGQLRAHLDGELEGEENIELRAHVEACPACQRELDTLRRASEWPAQQLAFMSAPVAPGDSASPALARFRSQLATKENQKPMLKQIANLRFRPAWTIAAVAVLLLASFTIQPVRAWAGGLLGLFRVQQITVLSLDPSQLTDPNNGTVAKELSQLFADTVHYSRQPGKPQPVSSAAEASKAAGFTVRLPTNIPSAPQLVVEGGTAFDVTINRAKAQNILNELDKKAQLPASLDGAKIAVDIPAAVMAAYNCPNVNTNAGSGDKGNGKPIGPGDLRPAAVMTRPGANCTVLTQLPSPTVTTPPNLDMAQLAQIGLQATGMKAEEAAKLSQSIDWNTTLVVPLPRNAASAQDVKVDGVKGNLLMPLETNGGAARFVLLWVKDGVVYSYSGFGTQAQAATAAASLELK